MPHVKLISSCPLVQSPSSGLWVPDEARRKVYTLNRRKFIKLIGVGTIGFAGVIALDSLRPEPAEAQWYNLIPVFLAGMGIIDRVIEWGSSLGMRLALQNRSNQYQEGNVGVRLISYRDRPIYSDGRYVDPAVPPLTEREYLFGGFPCGPRGANTAYAASDLNQLSQGYQVV